jgi:hypothetical protein
MLVWVCACVGDKAHVEDPPPEGLCAEGQSACEGICVDTQSNHDHCGGCGNVCSASQVCSLGGCSDECAAGLTECGADCIDTTSTVEHCGGCDMPCTDKPAHGQAVCVASQCEVACDDDALTSDTGCLGCAGATIVEAAPVAYWRLGETSGTSAIDASGNGAHGLYVDVGLGAPGVASDGDASIVLGTPTTSRLARASYEAFPADAVTVELWMRSSATNPGTALSYAASATNTNTLVIYDYTSLEIWVAGQSTESGVILNDGRWHHVATTWESSTGNLQVFVDGMPRFTTTLAQGATLPSGGTLVLGQEQDCLNGCFELNQHFHGEMDEVALFDRVLTEAEIATHYQTVTCTP